MASRSSGSAGMSTIVAPGTPDSVSSSASSASSVRTQARAAAARKPASSANEAPSFSRHAVNTARSEEHTSELQSLMRISYAVFCLKKKKTRTTVHLQQPKDQHMTERQTTKIL